MNYGEIRTLSNMYDVLTYIANDINSIAHMLDEASMNHDSDGTLPDYVRIGIMAMNAITDEMRSLAERTFENREDKK